jgi:hypothetical protein
MDKRSLRTALAALVATVAVVGLVWAGTAMLGGERSPAAAAPSPVDRSTADYGSGITAAPLGDTPVALTAEDAMEQAGRVDMPKELMPGTPTAELRSVTITTGSAARGEQPSKKVDATPAWVLVYANSPADVHGPATLTDERRKQIAADSSCSFIVIIDANSSETLALKQRCTPRR